MHAAEQQPLLCCVALCCAQRCVLDEQMASFSMSKASFAYVMSDTAMTYLRMLQCQSNPLVSDEERVQS